MFFNLNIIFKYRTFIQILWEKNIKIIIYIELGILFYLVVDRKNIIFYIISVT